MEIRNNSNDIAWRSAGPARKAILTEDGKFDDCSLRCLMTERCNRLDRTSQFGNTIKAITLSSMAAVDLLVEFLRLVAYFFESIWN